MYLSELHCYPVKSCRGIAAQSWQLDVTGLAHDRSFMVVTPDGTFLTQRELPALALVGTALTGRQLVITAPRGEVAVDLDHTHGQQPLPVTVWDDTVGAFDQGDEAAALLADHLGISCRLVRMDARHPRLADPQYAPADTAVGFADGFPLLLIGAASLVELNARLPRPLPMNRFRPNLVVADSAPFAEDSWRRIRIGPIEMDVVKPCARCTIPTVEQTTGRRDGAEPLRTLGTYRRGSRGVLFGQNVVHRSQGPLTVGDPVEVLTAVS
jgi:uncharacterized protein